MSDFYDSVETIDQSTIETSGLTYPYCQWVHGNNALEDLGQSAITYTGGWFIPKDLLGSAPAGWTPMTLKHSDNTRTEGYGKRDIDVAVLATRSRWTCTNNGQMRRFPWKQYDQALAASDSHKATGHTQVAVAIQGLEGQGVFVLTLKGMTGKAWKQTIIDFSKLVRLADEMAHSKGKKGKFPLRAFWLKAGPQRDSKGTPIFVEVGSKATGTRMITPVTLIGVSDKPSEADVQHLFVGAENLAQFNTLWEEAQLWRNDTAWDGSQDTAPVEDANGVAPIEEDENVPF